MNTQATLCSEVEINQHLIAPGDTLIYEDAVNYESWLVTALFDGGFEATCPGEEKDFYFSGLQYGWRIAEATKRKHISEERAVYTSPEEWAATGRLNGCRLTRPSDAPPLTPEVSAALSELVTLAHHITNPDGSPERFQ